MAETPAQLRSGGYMHHIVMALPLSANGPGELLLLTAHLGLDFFVAVLFITLYYINLKTVSSEYKGNLTQPIEAAPSNNRCRKKNIYI